MLISARNEVLRWARSLHRWN